MTAVRPSQWFQRPYKNRKRERGFLSPPTCTGERPREHTPRKHFLRTWNARNLVCGHLDLALPASRTERTGVCWQRRSGWGVLSQQLELTRLVSPHVSPEGGGPQQGSGCPPGGIGQCLKTLLITPGGGGGFATGTLCVEPRDAADHRNVQHSPPQRSKIQPKISWCQSWGNVPVATQAFHREPWKPTRQIPSLPDSFVLSCLPLIIPKVVTCRKPIKALLLVADEISWRQHRGDPHPCRWSRRVLSSMREWPYLPPLSAHGGSGACWASSSSPGAYDACLQGGRLHHARTVQTRFRGPFSANPVCQHRPSGFPGNQTRY